MIKYKVHCTEHVTGEHKTISVTLKNAMALDRALLEIQFNGYSIYKLEVVR